MPKIRISPALTLLFCLLAGTPLLLHGQQRQRLSAGWQFVRMDMANAWEVFRPVVPDKPESVPLWQDVTLPHCYNAVDAVSPDVNYYQGAAWYRTLLTVDNPYTDGHTLLHFEGVGQKARVYVYTREVARHVGGYDAWDADITQAVREFRQTEVCRSQFHGRVPVAVRCDNGRDTEMIPSDMSDFCLYGGICRPMYLTYLPQGYLADVAVTPRPVHGSATVEVSGSVQGIKGQPLVHVRVVSPRGSVVADRRVKTDGDHFSASFTLHRPLLWSPGAPMLYRCELVLEQSEPYRHTEQFGIRSCWFEEHGPFLLNGRRLVLHGTHRHEDHAGVGAAMTDDMIRREMQQIKDMGANFIRLGHYQQQDLVLHLCDSLGLLVWEEIPWCRGGLGGERYRAQAEQMLTAMIRQHRNHPSVILWGLGNENDWPGDFPEFDRDSIRAFMSHLNDMAHRLDPTRLTSIRRCDFAKDVPDVYSPSIWAGWYSSKFTDYRSMVEEAAATVPRLLHIEWGADSHAGRHADQVATDVAAGDKNGDWSETYAVKLFDWHLREQAMMPRLTGSAFWSFKDFATPLRPNNPIPYVNEKGVVQRDGTPKETFYVVQSYWATRPMLHIYGHTWPERAGRERERKEVLVYSNCSRVELLVNGVTMGMRSRRLADYPAAGFHWSVPLRQGDNTLVAVGYSGKTVLRDTVVQRYETRPWGTPVGLRLTRVNGKAGEQLVEARLVDACGVTCLDASRFICFACSDPTALLIDQGTATGSRRIQLANGRATIRLAHAADGCQVSAWLEDGSVPRAGIDL